VKYYPAQHDLSEEIFALIQKQLEQIAALANADLVLLADTSGQELSTVGELMPMQLEILSALSAAQLGASQELARTLKLTPSYIWIIYEGTPYNCSLCALANYLLFLLVPSDKELTSLRDRLTPHLNQLLNLLKGVKRDPGAQQSPLMPDLTSHIIDSMDLMWSSRKHTIDEEA